MLVVLACMSAAAFNTSLLSGEEVYHVLVSVCWWFYLRTLTKKKKKRLDKIRVPKAIQDDSVICAIL